MRKSSVIGAIAHLLCSTHTCECAQILAPVEPTIHPGQQGRGTGGRQTRNLVNYSVRKRQGHGESVGGDDSAQYGGPGGHCWKVTQELRLGRGEGESGEHRREGEGEGTAQAEGTARRSGWLK